MRYAGPIVAHIHESLFSKSETFIYNYVSNLSQFHPICLAREFTNLDQFPFPPEDLCCLPSDRGILGFICSVLEKCLDSDLRAERVLRARRAQLLHAHFGPNGVCALRLRRRLGIPLVTTFYGYDMSRLAAEPQWQRRYRKLFQEGDLFLVEGFHMKSRLCDLGCCEDKIRIQRIAVGLDKIPFRSRSPKKSGDRAILIFSGRLVEKKGLIYALEAVRSVRERCGNFELRIIGDGPLKPEVQDYIEQHRMHDYVSMLGFLDYREYLEEMQKGDLFVSPSVTASNGSTEGGAPTTILEAQAMGMPVLSTYHADIPHVVVVGESALLSHERDSEGLAEHLLFLLENQENWHRMGRAGRAFVEENHNLRKEVPALEQKYESLCYGPSSGHVA